MSLATGTRCIGVASMVQGQGQVLHDCHAEVLCRRAFHRHLLSEMRELSPSFDAKKGEEADGRKRKKILRLVSEEDLQFDLEEDVSLHFYVSTLPCGECTLVPLQSKLGTLARKLETSVPDSSNLVDRNRTGAKPSRGMPNDPKADGMEFHQEGILRYKSGRSDTRPAVYRVLSKLTRNHLKMGFQFKGNSLAR